MTDISSQTPAASTSQHDTIIELSMRRDLAKRMGGIWIQKAAAEYVHARTVKDAGDLAAAKGLERRGMSYQQRAMECWSAVAQFNRILLEMKVPLRISQKRDSGFANSRTSVSLNHGRCGDGGFQLPG